MRRVGVAIATDPGVRRSVLLALLTLVASLLLSACSGESGDPTSVAEQSCPAGQWAADTEGYRTYRHDCEPYRGVHFTIYSDAASQASKAELAGLAEGTFEELTEEWGIESEDELRFTPGYTYYIYAHMLTPSPSQEAYRNGFLTVAVDYGSPPGAYQRDPWSYLYVLKHELTHVFQFTLTDCPTNNACPTWLDVWFREGQAVVTGGGYERPTLAGLNAWRARPDHINPIGISRWWDFPDEDRGGEYYPIFALAYAWLVDREDGLGATVQDMKDIFQLMAEGDSFHDAFEEVLGISVAYFQANFYRLMEAYLE